MKVKKGHRACNKMYRGYTIYIIFQIENKSNQSVLYIEWFYKVQVTLLTPEKQLKELSD